METTIHLNLPDDFMTLCTIYQIKTEYFIQTFINQVSLPEYYSKSNDRERLGTLFFLQFLSIEQDQIDVNRELEDVYLTLFNRTLKDGFEANPVNTEVLLTAGRNIMRQWLKAVLAERTKYITDRL